MKKILIKTGTFQTFYAVSDLTLAAPLRPGWCKIMIAENWADDKQSKARNLDSKYRQMALVGFDT